MEKVLVRGADGEQRELALVRREKGVVYVCAEARYREVISGNDDAVVGFPARDVEPLKSETPPS